MINTKEGICCPVFDPKALNKKTFFWKNKLFIRADVIQFLHMPLNMGPVVTKTMELIEKKKAAPKDRDFLMLAYDPSPWKSELYFTVTKEIPGANNVRLSGEFYARVFDGPYNAVPKWIAEMEAWAKSKKKVIVRHYFFYTYCPKCSAKYGHNYCVDFAKIDNTPIKK